MNKPAGKRKNSVLDWVVALLILAALGGLAAKIAAGFEYNWNWLVPLRFFVSIDAEGGWRAGLLMQGLLMTLRLAIWGGLLCAILGLIIGLMRTSNLLIMRVTSLVFVESVRNIPPLVFIFIMYFFVSNQLLPPKLISFLADLAEDNSWFAVLFCPPDLIENFLSGLLCIALYEASYVGEIVRGGIQSITGGQWEASRALGMRRWLTLRKVILPQALRKIVPPFTNQLISLVKDSSIISVISVQELTFTGIEVATTTGRLFETLLLISILYFFLCWPISLVLRQTETKRGSQSLA